MNIVTSKLVKKIDNYCIEELNIPSILLMENAAFKIVKNLNTLKCHNYCIVCGTGNNGGDGLAVARQLINMDKCVEIFLIGEENKLSKDCSANYNILKAMGIKVSNIYSSTDIEFLRDRITKSDIVVDAIFGTGLSRIVEGIYDIVISVINENAKETVSIDVPSGFHSDSGKVLGNSIIANRTISFQCYKKGFLTKGSEKNCGEIIIESIGIPNFVLKKFDSYEYLLDRKLIKGKLKKRDKYAHKGDFGRVLICAGSKGFTGASYISTMGSVRSGAGLVTLSCPEDIREVISTKCVEFITIENENREVLESTIGKSNCIAIGPGMGNNKKTLHMVNSVIKNAKCPIVIDADGINVLKDNLYLLYEAKNKVVITPHLGEMSRITGISIEKIKEDKVSIAKNIAKKYNIIVLLKGYNTIITDGNKVFINSTGNSAMASGGMGDCLTGVIASFIAQGYDPFIGTYISAYIHGYCGDKLSEDMFCVNASDVLKYLPKGIKEIVYK